MTRTELYTKRRSYIAENYPYELYHFTDFNFHILDKILYRRKSGRGDNSSYNEAIIMADTETSKKRNTEANHIVAWTISIRAFDMNIATIWGQKPTDMMKTIAKILKHMHGDETYIYFHNLSYDYYFLRQFLFKEFGWPDKMLNLNPHQPIYIKWSNGLILKDSLILFQRKLEKVAIDYDVEHKKAVGSWDYDKIRNQDSLLNEDELHYIENDTLAGVESIEKLMQQLNKPLFAMPLTATGVPREEVRKRGKENKAKETFNRNCFTFDQYLEGLLTYHGGYTHAYREIIGLVLRCPVECRDFVSSYPYRLLVNGYPTSNFRYLKVDLDFIIRNSEVNCFMFRLILVRPRLKDRRFPMPPISVSKCTKIINAIVDNGRVLAADYIEIPVTEVDARLIMKIMEADSAIAVEVKVASKGYLDRWFTDYIYQLFEHKCKLKGGPDPIAYDLAKAKLNSIYGLCCQRYLRDEIIEDYTTGEFIIKAMINEEEYEKYCKSHKHILQYHTGIYCTAYAMEALFELSECIDYEKGGLWIYSDTDSIYSDRWDYAKLEAYNQKCKEKLLANNYGPVVLDEKEYWLGVAEKDKVYTEFVTVGAKRYCARKEDGELTITVAGVPKKNGAKCLNDDISNFKKGFIFSGAITGKKTHKYIPSPNGIYIDENGNETADSIDMQPCNYILDEVALDLERIGGYYSEDESDVKI